MERRPSWIRRRDWYNPIYRWYGWRADRRFKRLIEQPCSEGNCIEWRDPKTGAFDSGFGPVDCPCGGGA